MKLEGNIMKTQTKMQKEQHKLAKLEAEMTSTYPEYEALCKKISNLNKKIYAAKENITAIKAEEFNTAATFTEERIKWMLAFEDTRAKYDSLRALGTATNGQLSFDGGYNPTTLQHALSIHMNQNDSVDTVEKYLNMFIPHICDNRGVWIKIRERTLSEFGVYHLVINDGTYKIIKTVYGRENTIMTYKKLHDALVYISKNIYE